MKKNRLINRTLFALGLSVIVFACSDDGGNNEPGGVAFMGIGSSQNEDDANTVTIPLRGGSVDIDDITLGGTAEVDVDYTLDDVTDEGIVITIIDDNDLEPQETIRLQIPSGGNGTHTVNIVNNCEDTENVYQAYFEGMYSAIEKYGPDPATDWFGPYDVQVVQDEVDPTKFYVFGFYGFATRIAYFKTDIANGTATFPAQTPINPGANGSIAAGSTGTIDIASCDGSLTVNLTYDGGAWDYYLQRVSDF